MVVERLRSLPRRGLCIGDAARVGRRVFGKPQATLRFSTLVTTYRFTVSEPVRCTLTRPMNSDLSFVRNEPAASTVEENWTGPFEKVGHPLFIYNGSVHCLCYHFVPR